MKAEELPLLELFTRLRQAGLPLGLDEYHLVLQALQSGFGISDRKALARLCRTLWVKSEEDLFLFNYHFEEVMAREEAELVPEIEPELLPDAVKSDVRGNFLISWWSRISLPIRFAMGGMLVLVTGVALWSVRPIRECPYFTSRPKEIVEKEGYLYKIKACKTNPTDKLEIKALQKHPWLYFNDNKDGTAILKAKSKNRGLRYTLVSSWDLQV